MDGATIVQLIGSVGFPIVACCGLFYYMQNDAKENKEAINNNTLVVTKLLTYLETKEGHEIDGK